MRLLLDTHAVLWAATAPHLLGTTATTLITDPSNQNLISVGVVWELAIKHRKGKLPEAAPLLADMATVARRLGARLLAIDTPHAVLAGGLDWDNQDPFDRLFAAQSSLEGAILISRDRAFQTLPTVRALW